MATAIARTMVNSEEAEKNSQASTEESSASSEAALQQGIRDSSNEPATEEDGLAEKIKQWEKDESEADEIAPKEYICPLTLSVMVDPVLTRHGHNFEREAILKWIARGTGDCPITRKPLRLSDMITNHQLRSRIHRWRRENDLNIRIIASSDDLHNIFGYIEFPEEARDVAEHPRDDPTHIEEVQRRRARLGLLGRIFSRGGRRGTNSQRS